MSESKEHFIRISKLFLNFKLRMFVAILCMIIAALCTGFHAWLVKPALDNVLINADRFYLYFIPIAILITGIIKGLETYIKITSLFFREKLPEIKKYNCIPLLLTPEFFLASFSYTWIKTIGWI